MIRRILKLRCCLDFISRHKYLVATLLFIVLVGFLDSNSYYQLYSMKERIDKTQEKINEYNEQYEKDSKVIHRLDAHPETMEKIARERYFMKKPNEDIYIFTKE